MGKAVGAVTGAIGGIAGGALGGLAGGIVESNPFMAANARIDDAATMGQAQTAYDQTQAALAQQQAFVQALNAQNGAGNQSNVFNQLQGVADGTGPNPAQAALNQATSANVANQAALMAGQRGSNANAGLIARQAALQGGNLQQQAAGQGATLQAQQSLNALNQMGTLASQQVAQQSGALSAYNSAAQNQQQNLLGALEQQNASRVNLVTGQNTVNSGTAAANVKGRNDFSMGLMQGGAAALSDKNAKKNVKSGDDDVQAFLDSISSKSFEYKDPSHGEGEQHGVMAQDLEKTPGGEAMVMDTPDGKAVDYGKGFGMMTAALAQINDRLKAMEGSGSDKKAKSSEKKPIKMAGGGQVPGLGADGQGFMPAPQAQPSPYNLGANGQGIMAAPQAPVQISLGADMAMPQLSDPVAAFMSGKSTPTAPQAQPFANFMNQQGQSSEQKGGQGLGQMIGMLAKSGGGMSQGGKVNGKASKKGDNLDNDTVPTMLSPGEIVLPRSIALAKDAPEKAAAFVRALQRKKGRRSI